MRKLSLLLGLLLIPNLVFAQRQVEYPRFKITFDGSTTVESGDTDGFWVWRTSSVTPAVSGAGTARIYFDGTNFRISENGGAYRVIGAGTVASVGLSLPASVFSVTGSPVTGSGTLTGTYVNQTGNTIFASPSGGGAGTPLFRNLVTADYGTGTVTSTSISNGTILFADWNQNSCATGNIPKWNGSAWACAGDDTTPGGTSWLTTGNTLGAVGKLGSIDAFGFDIIASNVIRGNVSSVGALDWSNNINFSNSSTNYRAITGGSNVGMSYGWMEFVNRTSTLPTAAGSTSLIVMDNGILKVNQANAGWVPLLGLSTYTLKDWNANDAEQPLTAFAPLVVRNNHPVLAFDASTNEQVFFTGIIPQQYDGTSSVDVVISWTSASAITGNVVWEAKFEHMDTSTDIDADSFSTALTGTQTAPGTSGQTRNVTITFTNAQADAIVGGAPFRLSITRLATNGGDTMTGDAHLIAVQVKK